MVGIEKEEWDRNKDRDTHTSISLILLSKPGIGIVLSLFSLSHLYIHVSKRYLRNLAKKKRDNKSIVTILDLDGPGPKRSC